MTDQQLPYLTTNKPIDAFANDLGMGHLIPLLRQELKLDKLNYSLYPDVIDVMHYLRAKNKKLAVCTNLAFEYGATVRNLLPNMDEYIFSFEIGHKKPETKIYKIACEKLNIKPNHVLFIGDSKRADFEGPLSFGMKAKLIDRGNGQLLMDIIN